MGTKDTIRLRGIDREGQGHTRHLPIQKVLLGLHLTRGSSFLG